MISVLCLVSISRAVPLAESLVQINDNSIQQPEPFFDALRDVRFLLFTRLNPTVGQQLIFGDFNSIRNSNFNVNLPTRVIIHGFQSDSDSDVNILLTAAFLRNGDFNVIVGEFSWKTFENRF